MSEAQILANGGFFVTVLKRVCSWSFLSLIVLIGPAASADLPDGGHPAVTIPDGCTAWSEPLTTTELETLIQGASRSAPENLEHIWSDYQVPIGPDGFGRSIVIDISGLVFFDRYTIKHGQLCYFDTSKPVAEWSECESVAKCDGFDSRYMSWFSDGYGTAWNIGQPQEIHLDYADMGERLPPRANAMKIEAVPDSTILGAMARMGADTEKLVPVSNEANQFELNRQIQAAREEIKLAHGAFGGNHIIRSMTLPVALGEYNFDTQSFTMCLMRGVQMQKWKFDTQLPRPPLLVFETVPATSQNTTLPYIYGCLSEVQTRHSQFTNSQISAERFGLLMSRGNFRRLFSQIELNIPLDVAERFELAAIEARVESIFECKVFKPTWQPNTIPEYLIENSLSCNVHRIELTARPSDGSPVTAIFEGGNGAFNLVEVLN